MWLSIVVFLGFLLFTVFMWAKNSGALALMQKATAISDVVDGQKVTIKGTVEVLEEVVAPFSERRCAAFDLKISEEQIVGNTGNKHHGFVPIIEESESRNFVVVDEAGNRAIVDSTNLKLLLKFDARADAGTLFYDKRAAAFLKERGITTGFLESKRRVQEGVLEAGESVTVNGVASWDEQNGARRLRIVRPDGGAVIVRDR